MPDGNARHPAAGVVGQAKVAPHNVMCDDGTMATNLSIDEALLEEALSVGGHRTKRETVNEALREFIQRRRRSKLSELFGKIDYDPRYDYKKDRRRR